MINIDQLCIRLKSISIYIYDDVNLLKLKIISYFKPWPPPTASRHHLEVAQRSENISRGGRV